MNAITRIELEMALTQYYRDFQEHPETFNEYGTPEEDAEAVTNILFDIIRSTHN